MQYLCVDLETIVMSISWINFKREPSVQILSGLPGYISSRAFLSGCLKIRWNSRLQEDSLFQSLKVIGLEKPVFFSPVKT